MRWIDKDREIMESSVMCIPERVREIDPDYRVVRNHAKHRFEIHHMKQIDGTFSLLVPFDELDNRTVQLVRETRIERSKILMEQMEKENLRLENEIKNKAKDYTDSVIKDIHDYVAPKGVVDTVPEDASILKDIGGELM